MRASSNVSPGSMRTLGETFQLWPRSRAACAPVPSVARPPWPGSPEKFSGLIDRDRSADKRANAARSTADSVAGTLHLIDMPRPFRADQVGSLLRPPELLAAREQHARGALSREAMRRAEDA